MPAPDGPGVLVVRPESLRILRAEGAPNTVTATVVCEARFRGTHRTVVTTAGGAGLTATPVAATAPTTENEDARA
ncbi:MAG: TOBE domain-containing protein [Pseudonocardia sp.]|nr:TOBE domain-containing protein [Pseudonocardia sp.]